MGSAHFSPAEGEPPLPCSKRRMMLDMSTGIGYSSDLHVRDLRDQGNQEPGSGLGPLGAQRECGGDQSTINKNLGPEGRLARSRKMVAMRYDGASFGAGMAETQGATGLSARATAGWESRKRKTVVADHTPVQGGGCAKCPATKLYARGLCRLCYQRQWRRQK